MAPTASFTARIIGTWNLTSYTATSTNDPIDVLHPFGSDCRGRAIFGNDGYVATYIQARDVQRPLQAEPSNDDRFPQCITDLAYTARKTISYSAPFRLEFEDSEYTEKATIHYEVEMSIPTLWIGRTETRGLEIREVDGRTHLSFKPPLWVDASGVERIIVVETVRAPDSLERRGPQGRL